MDNDDEYRDVMADCLVFDRLTRCIMYPERRSRTLDRQDYFVSDRQYEAFGVSGTLKKELLTIYHNALQSWYYADKITPQLPVFINKEYFRELLLACFLSKWFGAIITGSIVADVVRGLTTSTGTLRINLPFLIPQSIAMDKQYDTCSKFALARYVQREFLRRMVLWIQRYDPSFDCEYSVSDRVLSNFLKVMRRCYPQRLKRILFPAVCSVLNEITCGLFVRSERTHLDSGVFLLELNNNPWWDFRVDVQLLLTTRWDDSAWLHYMTCFRHFSSTAKVKNIEWNTQKKALAVSFGDIHTLSSHRIVPPTLQALCINAVTVMGLSTKQE